MKVMQPHEKNGLMFLTDIPEGKKIRGILWNSSIPSTWENQKLRKKNKALHIQIAKSNQQIKLVWPVTLPPALYNLFFDEFTDQLRDSVLNKQVQIQRNQGDNFLVCCEDQPEKKGVSGWLTKTMKLENDESLSWWQKLKVRSVVTSLNASIGVLRKVQASFKNPALLNKNLFDEIATLEKTHKKLAHFLEE